MPAPETIAADNCNDGLDNDCDGLADAEDPDCILPPPAETECFDGIDDDGDGAIDCADSDCAGAANGECDTGIPGVCATGQTQCLEGTAQCVQTVLPSTEICDDTLDNDCDGLADAEDPDCAPPVGETGCFDGIDDDGDGAIDCADSDCAGATDGECDTGIPGVCATGQTQCVEGSAQCVQTVLPSTEICDDTLDNNCDGLADADDPDCQVEGGDVGLIRLIVPKKIVIAKKNETAQKVINVLAQTTGITEEMMVTTTLTAGTGAGIMVTIDPPSITREFESEMSGEGEIEAERFGFRTTIVCTEKGTWAVNWTANIIADQNSDPANDTLEGTSQVICKSPAKHSD